MRLGVKIWIYLPLTFVRGMHHQEIGAAVLSVG